MPSAVMIVYSDPNGPEVEEAYNTWYTKTHIHEVAAHPGVVSATRYKVANDIEVLPGIVSDPHGYLAIYELEAETPEELAQFAKALRSSFESGSFDVSSDLDFPSASATVALPMTERVSIRT